MSIGSAADVNVVARARSGARRRLTGGRSRFLATLALALGLMFGATAAMPEVGHASEPGLEMCVKGVEELVGQCLGGDPSWAQEAACEWLGGVGILVCLAAEAAKMAAGMLPSPI